MLEIRLARARLGKPADGHAFHDGGEVRVVDDRRAECDRSVRRGRGTNEGVRDADVGVENALCYRAEPARDTDDPCQRVWGEILEHGDEHFVGQGHLVSQGGWRGTESVGVEQRVCMAHRGHRMAVEVKGVQPAYQGDLRRSESDTVACRELYDADKLRGFRCVRRQGKVRKGRRTKQGPRLFPRS